MGIPSQIFKFAGQPSPEKEETLGRSLTIPHHAYLLPVPAKIRPHIGAALAADAAGEARLNVGQPQIVRQAVTADGDRLAAAVVGSIDQDAGCRRIAALNSASRIPIYCS